MVTNLHLDLTAKEVAYHGKLVASIENLLDIYSGSLDLENAAVAALDVLTAAYKKKFGRSVFDFIEQRDGVCICCALPLDNCKERRRLEEERAS